MNRILRLDMGSLSARYEEVPEKWRLLWGRGLTSRIIADEVDPSCDALGHKNKLALSAGPLAGLPASSTARISVGAKSPLTGGIKEANGGGTTAWKMGRLGLKAVIVEGLPEAKGTFIAVVDKDGARIIEAPELSMKGLYEASDMLKEKYGKNIGLAVIGPAGEMLLTASGISHMDKDGIPSRFTARGGVGAVMGSKCLKAIVFDDAGCKRPDSARPEEFAAALKAYNQAVLEAPSTAGFRKMGTANLVRVINGMGGLPTKNFSRGTFDKFEEISAEKLRATIEERGGDPEHACMPGCVIACSNVYVDKAGETIVSPLEYETIGLVGSNCMIGNLDDIARLNREMNDLGLDTIDLGGAIGVAMEAGLIPWGDAEAALGLLQEVRKGTVTGRVIGSGGAMTAKILGVRRAPVSKGQVFAAYDPRAVKGLGVTYATSVMGADHTAGQTVRAQVDHRSWENQVNTSRNAQVGAAVYDTLGLCNFIGGAMKGSLDLITAMINAHEGLDMRNEDFQKIGRETLKAEVTFNMGAGLHPSTNGLPEWIREEVLPDTGTNFDVPVEDMKSIFDDILKS